MARHPPNPQAASASPSPPTEGAGKPANDARRSSVQQLFEEHNRALVTFLATRLHSRAEARDVAQEAYVRMLQLEDTGAVGFLRAYLFRIASNIAIDRLRKRSVREDRPPQALFEELLTTAGPERNLLARQELDIVRRALAELPERHQQAFALYMFGDQSIADIAQTMRVTQRMIRHYLAETLAYCRVKRDRGNGEIRGGGG